MTRPSRNRSGPAPLALLAAVSGCTLIALHTPPPRDWPALKVTVVRDFWQTQACAGINPVFAATLIYTASGCARVNFDTMTCTIYLVGDGDEALEHEQEHCRGMDHVGSTALRDYWMHWKEQHRSTHATP